MRALPTFLRSILVAWCCLGLASAHGAEMILAGTHPTSPLTPFPGIHVLKAYEGRIYLGYGDWNLYPAVTIVSYNPLSGAFHVEHSPGSDSIGTLRVLGNDLYATSIDPVHFEEFTDFSARSGGVWRRYAPGGFLHVFDIASVTGDDLWIAGAKTPSDTPTQGGAVWFSPDRGQTWSDVTVATSVSRYYYCFTLRGKFYVHDTVYDGLSATRIAAFPYQQLYKPSNVGFGESEIVLGIAQLTPGFGGFSRQSLVRFDGTNWQVLKANVLDLTVAGASIYTLDYNPVTGSNELQVATYDGINPLAWTPLPITGVPANAKALEVLDDSIYVGDTSGNLWAGKWNATQTVPPPSTVIALPDGFGRAIAINETTLAIGAPEFSGGSVMDGQVTVWSRAGAGQSWQSPQAFFSPFPTFSGWFGKDIAVDNNFMAVLEAGAGVTGLDRGDAARVHLYERVSNVWQWRQTLTNVYAQSLALKSDALWVGASTVLYRYLLAPGLNGVTATLAESFSSGSPGEMYEPAARVSADGNRVAFGNTGDFSRFGGPGQVSIYEREGEIWRNVATLRQNTPPLPPGLAYQPDAFGYAVAMAGDWLAVGAPRDDAMGLQAGAVFLYQRVLSGTDVSYVARQKILSPVLQQDHWFGAALAFNGHDLLIGSPGWNSPINPREGRLYLYRLQGTNAVLVDDLPAPATSQTEFGVEAALDGQTILAGSRTSHTNSSPLSRILMRPLGDVVTNIVDLSLCGAPTPAQAVAGTPVQYNIVTSNAGPSNATSVVLKFAKPTNGNITTFSSSSGVCTNGSDGVTCLIPELAAGANATLQVTVEPAFTGFCERMFTRVTVSAAEFEATPRDNEVELAVNDFPPEISLTAPAPGTVVRFGTNIILSASASATNGVTDVSFYTNNVRIGGITNAPYTLAWNNVRPGTYVVTARVTDQCGTVRTSSPAMLVATSNALPSITITEPLDRTRFVVTNGIRISAVASDSDGAIAQVRFFRGTTLMAALASAPYTFLWSNAPAGNWVIRAVATDNDGATNTSAPVLVVIGVSAPGTNWVAYNDHSAGPGTHANATRWDIRGDSPGPAGSLKNIATGANLPASLVITRVNLANISSPAFTPAFGTPAAQVFGGYIDYTSGLYANVPVAVNQSVTFTFNGLNPGRQYSLKMTAVRGNSGYFDRWTLMTLNGAQSFRSAHTPGTITQGFGSLAANQVAINTGYNSAGALAAWEEITPGPSGTIAVISTQYTGPLPAGGTGATGPYGYAPTMLRLEDATISLPLVTTSAVSQTVSPGATPAFAVTAAGEGALVYQWFHNGSPLLGATSSMLNLPPVITSAAGAYTLRVSATNGHAISAPAILTVLRMQSAGVLEISGPVGQQYRVDARATLNTNDVWTTVTNLALPTSPFPFTESSATNATQGFYRVIPVP